MLDVNDIQNLIVLINRCSLTNLKEARGVAQLELKLKNEIERLLSPPKDPVGREGTDMHLEVAENAK